MKFKLLAVSLVIAFSAGAQEYSALFIPDSLRKGADVVKRDEEYILTIKSAARYTLYERHVYTILNAGGTRYARYLTNYDKYCSINSVSGKLFNMLGKQVKHSKKGDWSDNSAYDGFSLLSDARYKVNEFYSAEYPYTVEYEEEDEHSGTQGFPGWMPQSSPFMSVQHSRFTIIAPADYLVRYKPLNFKTEPVITQKGDLKTYVWELRNIPAKKYESSAPPFTEMAPVVYFAPSKFEVAGFQGDMSTWEGYGKFMYELIKGRDVLPEPIKAKVHELTDGLKNSREKIPVLYDFLQKNTRYISIQLGIGGWQPFEAKYVAEKKYGDCKALSNYMIALLKEAGIQGKYVEIYGGSHPPSFIEDFPFSQANHVISCVPLGKDTVWLECTSQTASAGYMGNFTGNRKAILVDETGGHVVQTPVYRDNRRERVITAVADQDGNLLGNITTRYCGLQQDFPHSLMHDASAEDRQKYLNQMFNLPTYEVIKSNYTEHKDIVPSMDEYLQIHLKNYVNITGKRLFIVPYIFSGATERPVPDTARQYEYLVEDAFKDVDSIEIEIPAGYKPEKMTGEVSIQNKFGTYVFSIKMTGNKLNCYRQFEKYSGRFPAGDYNEMVKFLEQVYKSDRSKIVLVKAE